MFNILGAGSVGVDCGVGGMRANGFCLKGLKQEDLVAHDLCIAGVDSCATFRLHAKTSQYTNVSHNTLATTPADSENAY
uniref:Uncharacterized protein n=1 Tax=Tanacetum cinerariifolium TaxID=118510 RepID=A0A699H2U8_TANCI|nr:hypothetical protein [Tanacetum cinerariifolium]